MSRGFCAVTPSPSSSPSHPRVADRVCLRASFAVPIACVAIAFPLTLIQPIVGVVVALFGLFLTYQAASLQLQLTDTALEIYRGNTPIRCFPYDDWQHWEIFWPALPILFYFREVNSIHFLPILFDPKTLTTCLEHHVPRASDPAS